MTPPRRHRRFPQAGIVLVSSLLLLLVVTIIALSMFRSFGLQERIAGNVREKQRALQVAASTEAYAEWWLSKQSQATFAIENGNANAAAVTCTNPSSLAVAGTTATTGGQICLNALTALSAGPVTQWPATAPAAGVGYTPPNMTAAAYSTGPRFYIQDLGLNGDGRGELYQIDAFGFGLTTTAVAVVESTFTITSLTGNPMGP